MKSFTNLGRRSGFGFQLLQRFPAQGVSFSTVSGKPEFNILLFCPRNESHLERFRSEYPDLIKSTKVQSASVTDVAHNPKNNVHAITALLNKDIKPSEIIAHLALIARNKKETDEQIEFFRDAGVKTIFVVRGNEATLGKDKSYTQHPEGYESVPILIERVKELAPGMKIAVTGYPGKHPYAETFEEDMKKLKEKVDCGADLIITQHFFDNAILVAFVKKCKEYGIDTKKIKIMPSILHLGNPQYLFKFSASANVDIPTEVIEILFGQEGMTTQSTSIKDPEVRKRAIAYTVEQIKELMDLKLDGVSTINIYVANDPSSLKEIFAGLSLGEETKSRSI